MNINFSKINIFVLLEDIVRNILAIIMAALIGFLSVTVYARNIRVSEYTASSTLVVSAKSTTSANAFAALSTASSMAGVLKEVFESKILLEKVEEDIGKIPGGTKVSANVVSETNLLVLKVTSKDPKTAYLVCNSVLKHYNDISEYLFSNAVLEVVAEPEIPTEPSNTFRTNLYRCLAALGMAAAVAAIIVLFGLMRKTVKNIKNIEDDIDGKFLGVIYHEKKTKTFKSFFKKIRKACLVSDPLCSFPFEQSNNKIAKNVQYLVDAKNYKTILITSVAENEGKSTISTNLAISLGNLGKKVLLVDVDFRKPAIYKIIDLPNEERKNDLVSFVDGKCEAESAVLKDVFQNVDIALNFGAKKKSISYILSEKMTEFIEYAKENYDYVIMDSSPIAVGTDVQHISDIADSTVIVIHHDYVGIDDIGDAIDELKEGKSEYLGFIVNNYIDFNPAFSGQSSGYYKGYGYGSEIFEGIED